MRIEGTDEITVELKYGFKDPTKDSDGYIKKITVREIIGADEMSIQKKNLLTVGDKMTEIMKRTFVEGDGKSIPETLLTSDLFQGMFVPDREMLFTAIYGISYEKMPVYLQFCPNAKLDDRIQIIGNTSFDKLEKMPAHEHKKPKVIFPYTLNKKRMFRGEEVSDVNIHIPKGYFQEKIAPDCERMDLKLLLARTVIFLKGDKFSKKPNLTADEVGLLSSKDLTEILAEVYMKYWGYANMQIFKCPKCESEHIGILDTKNFFKE